MKLSIVIWCLVLSVGLVRSFDEEDNDFADFETDFEEDIPAPEEKVQTPVKSKQDEKEFADNDDADDGLVEDEFDHFTDNDEFEGFGASDSASEKPQPGEPKLTIAKVPMHLRGRLDSYWVEMLFITGLVVYFINYLIGKNKNIQIANSWFNAHKAYLEDQFALVGDDGKKETEQLASGVLMKESDSIFTLWCSGRTCVEGMLLELKLIKRQDLLSLAMGIMKKEQDQLTIKVELSKDAMDTFVLALASKKSASKLFKEMIDLKQYCVSVAKADEKFNIPTGYSLLSEIAEASSAFIDARLTSILHKFENVIEYIHISDQYSGAQVEEGSQPTKKPETKKMLIVSFFIHADKTDQDLRQILQLVIYLIDKLKRFKLSREGKTKAEKNRFRVEEEFQKNIHAIRQEEAIKKREDKRRQEKEKMMNEENVDKQVRMEKKMKKKDAKKSQPKMKSMSIHL